MSAQMPAKPSLLKRVIGLGTSGLQSRRRRRQIEISNVAALICFLTTAQFVPLLVYGQESPLATWVVVGMALAYTATWFCNHLGYDYLGRLVSPTLGTLSVALLDAGYELDTPLPIAMFNITCLAFCLFDVKRNPLTLLTLAVTPGVLFILLEHDMHPPIPALPLSTDTLRNSFDLTMVSSLCGLLLMLSFFYRTVGLNEQALRQAANSLREEISHIERAQAMAQRARERSESAGAVKGRFLAAFSHELRAPLGDVLGALGLLSASAPSCERRSHLQVAQVAAVSLKELLNNVLQLAREDAQAPSLSFVPFNVSALLEDVMLSAPYRPAADELSVIIDVDPELPLIARGDEAKLRQVLSNLVSNAFKFTTHGCIRLEARRWPSTTHDFQLELVLHDSGIGVAPNQRPQLFKLFSQTNKHLNRPYDGAGLGLAICHLLTTAMGGEIRHQEKNTPGASFRVSIPLSEADEHIHQVLLPTPLPHYCVVSCSRSDQAVAISHALQRLGAVVVSANPDVHVDVLITDDTHCDKSMLAAQFDICESAVLSLGGDEGEHNHLPLPVHSRQLHRALLRIRSLNHLSSHAPSIPPQPPRQGNGPRVLLAEDNPVNQQILKALLQQLHADVTVVGNGQLALDLFRRRRWDLVLMDLHMPIMDGLSATHAMRQVERARGGEATTIAALSANSLHPEMLGENADFDLLLPKPVQLAELRQALGSHRARLRTRLRTGVSANRSSTGS